MLKSTGTCEVEFGPASIPCFDRGEVWEDRDVISRQVNRFNHRPKVKASHQIKIQNLVFWEVDEVQLVICVATAQVSNMLDSEYQVNFTGLIIFYPHEPPPALPKLQNST